MSTVLLGRLIDLSISINDHDHTEQLSQLPGAPWIAMIKVLFCRPLALTVRTFPIAVGTLLLL